MIWFKKIYILNFMLFKQNTLIFYIKGDLFSTGVFFFFTRWQIFCTLVYYQLWLSVDMTSFCFSNDCIEQAWERAEWSLFVISKIIRLWRTLLLINNCLIIWMLNFASINILLFFTIKLFCNFLWILLIWKVTKLTETNSERIIFYKITISN